MIFNRNKVEDKQKDKVSIKNVMKYESKKQKPIISETTKKCTAAISFDEKSTKQRKSLKRKVKDDTSTEPFIQ